MKTIKLVEAPIEEIEELNEEITPEEETIEEVVEETPETTIEEVVEDNNLITDETPEEVISFIDSPELEELREVLLDIEDDIRIVLLNDDLIVLTQEIENEMHIVIVGEEDTEYALKKMPLSFEEIQNDPEIVKYTPEEVAGKHSVVIDTLMKTLNPVEEMPEEVEEPVEEVKDEEETEDEKN